MNDNFLVSPPIEGAMDLRVRGRDVEADLGRPFEGQHDVCVSIWRDPGIEDLNEDNPAEQLVHAFSTGRSWTPWRSREWSSGRRRWETRKNMRVLVPVPAPT